MLTTAGKLTHLYMMYCLIVCTEVITHTGARTCFKQTLANLPVILTSPARIPVTKIGMFNLFLKQI